MEPSGSNQSSKGKKAKWDRIVLKVSGEAFAGNAGFGIDGDIVGVIAEEIFQVRSEYEVDIAIVVGGCLLYTSPSPRDQRGSRVPSSA